MRRPLAKNRKRYFFPLAKQRDFSYCCLPDE
jgi:hypothetical protein